MPDIHTLTDDDKRMRDLFASWARESGLSVKVDKIGNMFARRAGRDPNRLPVLFGSHLDSQPSGGKFDGALGVLAGLEVMRSLNDLGIVTEAPVELINWTDEEGARFGHSLAGSGVWAGVYAEDHVLALKDTDGISMGTEGMKYSLVSRDVIADSIETVVGCQGFDGFVTVGGCDKNMPGCVMAMGPTCRQAMDASALSSASPIAPEMPPVLAREVKQVMPFTLGSSKASTMILWSGPISLKTVSTAPICSAWTEAAVNSASDTQPREADSRMGVLSECVGGGRPERHVEV